MAIGKALGAIVSPVLSLLGAFDKPKAPKPVLPLPSATPRSNSVALDALSARRGSSANQRTGSLGAESSASSKKTRLGQ